MTTTKFVNTAIPEEELKQMEVLFKEFEKLREIHTNNGLKESEMDDVVNRIHLFIYLEALKKMIESVMILKSLLEESREGFISKVTNEGKLTLDEAEIHLLTGLLLEKQSLSIVKAPNYIRCFIECLNSTYIITKRVKKGVVTYETETSY